MSEESPSTQSLKRKAPESSSSSSTLYLETISRPLLDFDFELVCSVSNAKHAVYACLVCGKYFAGRGPNSVAYKHSIHADHHVFINLGDAKVYILPDNYEVTDPSLNDIVNVLQPDFTKDCDLSATRFDLSSKAFQPGFIGLNNIKANDYQNVVFMALSHILPLRDFFLFSTLPKSTELVSRFRHLVRKLWNTHAFKAQYSPHELVQEVSKSSKKRFDMTKRSDPVQFLTWFLNGVDAGLRSGDNGIVKELFEGAVVVESQQILGMSADFDEAREITSKSMPFLVLSLDLPPIPLFQDSNESNIIPQVGLSTLFTKYGGVKTQEDVEGVLKRYKITKMPKYLVVYFKRFVKVKKGVEYNPTIVNFNETQRFGDDVYRLVANVCAVEGGEGYVVYLRRQGDGEGWVEVRDLYVHDANWEIICLKNSYIQFWERV